MSSIASDATSITVSAFGEDMDLEKAIDQIYKELQNAMNYSHCSTRELAMEAEREGNFEDVATHGFQIQDHVDEMLELFKELKTVVKQVVGRPKGDDEKKWLSEQKEARKRKKAQQKLMDKQEAERLKREKEAQRESGNALNAFMAKTSI